MIVNFIGLREPGNHFKNKVAAYFDCPIISFRELSSKLFFSINEIYGCKNLSTRTVEELELLLREKITREHKSFYMDWMSTQLVERIFRNNSSQARNVQCVVTDIETVWEYKVLRTFLLSPKNKKANKMILIENDSLASAWYNAGYADILNTFDADACISAEDEDIEKEVDKLLKKWYVLPKESKTEPSVI